MEEEKIKQLIHSNFRSYFKQDQEKIMIGKVEVINIPILVNGKHVFCSFASEECYSKKPESKLLWYLRGINLCDYIIEKKTIDPILILESNQLATSVYLLAMTKQNLTISLSKKNNENDKLEIFIPLEIANEIGKELLYNNTVGFIKWLTKDEMLKNKEEK